jgi:type I restriction enzyme, R subunit
VRYQKAIDQALANTVAQLIQQPTPDLALIKKIRFLKAAVVISGDGTNEAADITAVRKQTKAWNAVENFCKSFNFDDPDQRHTGIAFLVVCDMLITGFDAPIEQVMYIDKKIKEHSLLQAIARTNRVKKVIPALSIGLTILHRKSVFKLQILKSKIWAISGLVAILVVSSVFTGNV